MVKEFSDFASKVQVSNEEVDLNGGVVWHSTRLNGPSGAYDAPLPPGLHISCGIAKIWSFSEDCGGFETNGASLNIVNVPETGTVFQTRIGSGAVNSFGYYLPPSAMQTDDPLLRQLIELSTDKSMINFQGQIMQKVPRLVSPIGTNYQGVVRESLLQARALELTALVAAEVGAGAQVPSSVVSRKCAERALDFIEAHLREPYRLDEIARATGVSVRTLTKAFRQTFGETIADYVRRRRMEEAAAFIELGASVSEAAYHVGYTPNAFSKAFKAVYRRSPTAK